MALREIPAECVFQALRKTPKVETKEKLPFTCADSISRG